MANQIIRKEINLIDGILSAAGGASATSGLKNTMDSDNYSSPTFYFEIVADSTISISFNVTLNGSADGTLATINVPLLTTAYTRIRSAAFTPSTANQSLTVVIDNTAGATKNVKIARVIIIQNAATIAATQTQVEVGNGSQTQESITATSAAPATYATPKYWLYTAANWDGTKVFRYDCRVNSVSTKITAAVQLQEDDGSFGSWTAIGTDQTTSSATNANLGTTFTPTDGRHYRLTFYTSNSKSAILAGGGTITITQTNTPTKTESQYLLLNTNDAGTGLQTYQTLWDSSEWNDTQGGLPTFKYSHDATNAADSSKLVDITGVDTDVSGATVTGANQQISAAFTMPASGDEVDTNVTVSTGVVGAVRILAIYAVNSAPPPVVSVFNGNQFLQILGVGT